MFRSRSQRSVQKVPLKGLFSDGIWQCDCAPRLPAQHFQTKNGGKNHGRWFYTCQKPQPTRCGFFLWDDEAKSRSTTVVLSNSRSEPAPVPPSPQSPQSPQTPTKPRQGRLFYTPSKVLQAENDPTVAPGHSASDSPAKETGISQKLANSTLSTHPPDQLSDDEDEFFDWPASEGEDQSKATYPTIKNPMPPPETPRKAVKFDPFSTPGKRRYDEMMQEGVAPWPTPSTNTKEDDIFTTPLNNPRGTNLFTPSGLLSPMNSPTPRRFRDVLGQELELTKEILQALQSYQVAVSPELQNAIQSIGSKHSLFTHGVIKGRDVSRSLLQKKNEQIVELQGKLAILQAERETDKAAIRHLTERMGIRKDTERKED